MLRFRTLTTAGIGAVIFIASIGVTGAVEPIKLRWASDHSGPPHPAAIAEVYFAEQLEKKIPGSKVLFFGPSRFTIFRKA